MLFASQGPSPSTPEPFLKYNVKLINSECVIEAKQTSISYSQIESESIPFETMYKI